MSKLDLSKPVKTRGGDPARIICTDRRGTRPVVYLIGCEGPSPEEGVYFADPTGRQYAGREHYYDLVQAPDQAMIDAAPLMLEALESIRHGLIASSRQLDLIDKAISAARGNKKGPT